MDLSHSDIAVLEEASGAFRQRMEAFEATRDVNDNYNKGKARLDFELLPEGRRLGLTGEEVGNQLRNAFFGALALRQLRGTNEFEVRVKLPKEQRRHLYHLEDLTLRTPAGGEVPLLDVVRVNRTEAFTSINRRDGRRVVSVGMDAQPANAVSRVLTAIQTDVLPELRGEYPGLTWTFQGSQADMRESTEVLWGGFMLAMMVIYGLLAVAFGSYAQPLIVMGAIPFGAVGAVIGHILLGYDLSLVSLMGIIALSGVVLNGSLIMVDHANRKRVDHSAFDAIHRIAAFPTHCTHHAHHLRRLDPHYPGNLPPGHAADSYGNLPGVRHCLRHGDYPGAGALSLHDPRRCPGGSRTLPAGARYRLIAEGRQSPRREAMLNGKATEREVLCSESWVTVVFRSILWVSAPCPCPLRTGPLKWWRDR